MALWRVVALCALVAGCGDDTVVPVAPLELGAGADDLGVAHDLAGPADLTPTDLLSLCPSTPDAWTPPSPPPDAGTFCAGTPIDGTCVQAFFAKIADCFLPAAGCCTCFRGNHSSCSWASGAAWDGQPAADEFKLFHDNASCGGSYVNFATTTWTAADGTQLTMTGSTSAEDAVCPGGTHVTFSFSDCADLAALISPPGLFTTCVTPY